MSDTSSHSINASCSAQEMEELLAQQPSTSSVQDDSHGHSDAEESLLEEFEVPGSPQQPAELNQQAPQSPAKKPRITAYALGIESLPAHLKQFLQAVKKYFTQSVNLEREKSAVSLSTFQKSQERMLCK